MTEFAKMRPNLIEFLSLQAFSNHDVEVGKEAPRSSTVVSQLVQNYCGRAVHNLAVAALQRGKDGGSEVCILGFLPTMKPQLSQLPLIVGYGRVSS